MGVTVGGAHGAEISIKPSSVQNRGVAITPDDLYADDLPTLLQLERLDRHLYRGVNTAGARQRVALYGGQVAAQALMAAGMSVEPDRKPHSLHGYFLRPGQIDKPVILRVDPDRDGRSFSARHVSAIQDGAVIFSMLASFHRADPVSTLDRMPLNDVPAPEECESYGVDPLVEMRAVGRSEEVDGHLLFPDQLWLRSAVPLPDDALTQACSLAYLSDYGSGFGQMTAEIGNGGPSLDHAIWFHEPVRAEEWILLDMAPRKATRVRGLYDAAMRDANGVLGAVVAQEHLLVRSLGPAEARPESP